MGEKEVFLYSGGYCISLTTQYSIIWKAHHWLSLRASIASPTRLLFLLSSVLIILLLLISVILFPSTSLVFLCVLLIPQYALCPYRIRLEWVGAGRSFTHAALTVWNSLPLSLRIEPSHPWAHFLVIWSPTYLDLLSLFSFSNLCCLMNQCLQRFWSVL